MMDKWMTLLSNIMKNAVRGKESPDIVDELKEYVLLGLSGFQSDKQSVCLDG